MNLEKNMLSSRGALLIRNSTSYCISSYSRAEPTLEELGVSHIQIHAPDKLIHIEIRQLAIRRIKCGLNEENNRKRPQILIIFCGGW